MPGDGEDYDWRSDCPTEQSEFKHRPICWSCGQVIWEIIRGITVIFRGKEQHVPVHPGECESKARREG